MSLNGERVDELLSGYLDGVLSSAETAEVESALQDAAVRQRCAELTELREQLRELSAFRQRTAPGLPLDFAARIRERIEAARPTTVSQAAGLGGTDQASGRMPTRYHRSRLALAAVMVTVAALTAVWLNPFYSLPHTPDNNQLAEGESAFPEDQNLEDSILEDSILEERGLADGNLADENAETTRFVTARWKQQVMFTVVFDIKLSPKGVREDFVAATFAAHGINLEQPVIAGTDLLEALSESSMTDRPLDGAGETLLYFVHADAVDLDRALRTFQSDLDRVPSLRTDVAFDTPINQLMLRIVASAGEQFSIEDSFAAQVGVQTETGTDATFDGIGPQGKLVSRTSRSSQASPPHMEEAAGQGMSTILLLVRLP